MEQRTAYFTSKFETREAQGIKTIEGYFIVYGQETELWEAYYEEIAQGACRGSLAVNDIRALFNHDTRLVLGRTSANTLTLREDSRGVYGVITINENDTEAMNVYARVSRGDITGCSFGFIPEEEAPESRSAGGYKNVVRRADVLEVSVCAFPAYPTTQINARRKAFGVFRAEALAQRKKQIKERIKNGKSSAFEKK